MSLGNLPLLSRAKSRSISPENVYGEKGRGAMADLSDEPQPEVARIGQEWHPEKTAARDLGKGWKVRPRIRISPGRTATLMDVDGPGIIQQIWMTPTGMWRHLILRFYWDHEESPSVECPIGDFFACGWQKFAQVSSLAVCVNPNNGLNCYWSMPFRQHCRITIENMSEEEIRLYYQINYALDEVPDTAAYFHAQFRRVNPLPYKEDYTILDGVKGHGQYVGTYMTWGANNSDWWGEGEIKFFMDGDKEYPTICGTGVEDYFCGAYGFQNPDTGEYLPFSTPYAGMPQAILPNGRVGGKWTSQLRFGLYRWHITDPVRFEEDLRVTIQALGWRTGGRYLPLQDDIGSVAFWYQSEPHAPFPTLPDRDALEII